MSQKKTSLRASISVISGNLLSALCITANILRQSSLHFHCVICDVYSIINKCYQIDLAVLDACQHCLQKSFRQQPRHSLIHSKMILTIHLLTSYPTSPCLPIYAKTKSHDTTARSYFYIKSLLASDAGHFHQNCDHAKNGLSFSGQWSLAVAFFSKLRYLKIASEHS